MTRGTVIFVNVDQGDCTIAIDADGGGAVLVDCPAGKEERALAVLETEGADLLRLVVATHSDLDHLGGVFTVASAFPTREVRVNGAPVVCADPDERKRLRAALRAIAGLKHRHVAVGDVKAPDRGVVGALAWCVLAPDQAQLLHAQGIGSPNHASVVIRLEVGNSRFLLAGDADGLSWRGLLDSQADLHADVLLIPHHGGQMQASDTDAAIGEVLRAVGARLAVLSFGRQNHYGHPHESTLAAIEALGLRLAATQPQGPAGPFALPPEWVGTIRCQVTPDGIAVSALT